MKTNLVRGLTAACFALLPLSLPSAQAANLLSVNDFVIGIDTDDPVINSSSPGSGNEDAPFVIDGDDGTKYLNFGKINTGFITALPPEAGATTVQSVRFTTANDAEERDPASWTLYGTNDTITTNSHHTQGDLGIWTEITSSDLTLPAARGNNSYTLDFSNTNSYKDYRVVFPTVKDEAAANSMQLAELQLYSGVGATGVQTFFSGDPAYAIGLDLVPDSSFPAGEAPVYILDGIGPLPGSLSQSDYPAAEGPGNVVDDTLNKYLNGGDLNSGFIVTPTAGSSVVRSFQLTTADDEEDRDPSMYELWGTNESIASTDNSFGLGENWTLVSSGGLTLPTERDTLGGVVTTGNETAYSSYKMIFPELKGEVGAMQIAETQFYTTADDTGGNFLTPSDTVLAIDADAPSYAADTKYLNRGGVNSGFIITPAAGSTTIDEFQITTANDADARDPAEWVLYGTNDIIESEENSQGDSETWVPIDSGTFSETEMPTDRQVAGAIVDVDNDTEYASYRMVFTALRDEASTDLMQIAGIQFFGEVNTPNVDVDNDGDVDGADFLALQRTNPSLIPDWEAAYAGGQGVSATNSAVPEPTTAVLLFLGLLATSATGRGRASRVATS